MTRVVDFPDQAAIDREAAEWVARLDAGALSEEDLRALRRWATQNPANRKTLNEMAAAWDMLDVLSLKQQPDLRVGRLSGHWKTGVAAIAASIAVVALVTGYLGGFFGEDPLVIEPDPTIYFTAVGEQRSVNLPDGSVVRINTNSRLQVDFSGEIRNITLQQGEAFFEVAESSRPFVVSAGRGHVTALGTAFAVRLSYNNVMKVDVTEGSVVVTTAPDVVTDAEPLIVSAVDDDSSRVLFAGDVVQVGESIDLVQTLEPIVLERQLSWRDGMLVFDGDTLESVIAEVSRYTPVEIVIADPALRELKIGGYFRTGDTDVLLDTLSSSFDVEADYIRPELVYLHRAGN